MVFDTGGCSPGGLPGLVMTLGKMAGGGAIPRVELDPLTVVLVTEDDDMVEEKFELEAEL